MTDLHSHILPGIDDGAPNLDASLALLDQCAHQGVTEIALTSHFRSSEQSLEDFLTRREESWGLLQPYLETLPGEFRFKLGAEVYFSPRLPELDVSRLCLEGTDVLLLELPMTRKPQFLGQTLDALQSEGIIPLIAHVERYPYVQEDPTLLARWLDAGALAQVNAGSLLPESKRCKMTMKLISWGLVQVVSGDVHSPEKRPQRLERAFSCVNRTLGEETAGRLQDCAHRLFTGQEPAEVSFHCPRKILGRWM